MERLKSLQAKRGISNHALRYTFVEWLHTYKDYDHNTARHVAAWTAYVEWYHQAKYDVQGLECPYVGMTYEQHAERASNIMGHSVQIHEQTYLPVSPPHVTRAQGVAAAAAAQPLSSAGSASAEQELAAAAAAVAETCSDDGYES